MSTRRLYGDASLIDKQVSQMQLMEKAADELAAVYKDEVTGKFWLKCYAISEAQGGGYLILIRLPLPTTEELIKIAITSEFEDETVAAVLRLLDEEALEKKDFRHLLLKRLERFVENRISQESGQQLIKIIKLSRLDDPMNKRDVLHKSKTEIQQDTAYFREIADRAKALLEKLR